MKDCRDTQRCRDQPWLILNGGQGEGYESWRPLVLEYDPRSRVRAAGSMMDLLSRILSLADSCSFEAFDAKVSIGGRVTEGPLGVAEHAASCAMVRGEIMDVAQARAATGSSPMLVDAHTKGKGKGKKGKGEGKDPKSKDDKGKGKGWKSEAKDNGAKSQDSGDIAQKKCFFCDRIGHMKSDCQQRANDMRKATAAGRPLRGQE